MTYNKALISPDKNKSMFDNIAARYDFLNKMISLGNDKLWRKKAVDLLNVKDGGNYVDAGCGTADLAIEIAGRFSGKKGKILGIDQSEKMLEEGRKKVLSQNLDSIISLTVGDALKIPVPDSSVDGVISGFVIRNIDDRAGAFAEWLRVLKPGGKCVILELSKPDNFLILTGYNFFANFVIPFIGLFLSKYKAYKYLIDSIKVFPLPNIFMKMMEESGFKNIEMKSMTFGVVRVYSGVK